MHKAQWCSHCRSASRENVARQILEKVFGKPFPSRRLDWLRNVTNYKMEIDCFCEELRLGVEIDGEQHLAKRTTWYVSAEQVKGIQERDKLKDELCKLNGVILLRVPHTIGHSSLQEFITKGLTSFGIKVPFHETIDVALLQSNDIVQIEHLKDAAIQRGGQCLSNAYHGNKFPMQWMCAVGHMWKSCSLTCIVNNTWCPECNLNKRLQKTFDAVKLVASNKGGKCLSSMYVPGTPLLWECEKGHKWSQAANQVQRGNWCLTCSRTNHQSNCSRADAKFPELKQLIELKGAECLTDVYVNNMTIITVKCTKGHVFTQMSRDIMRKTKPRWCNLCSKRPRLHAS